MFDINQFFLHLDPLNSANLRIAYEKLSLLSRNAGETEEVESQADFIRRLMESKGCQPEEITSVGPIYS